MRVIVAAALAAGACASGQDSFSRWMVAHGKKYATANEMKMRRAIFAANVAKINEHNAGKHSWTMGVNAFADLTAEEFKARYASGLRTHGYKPRHSAPLGRTHVKANPTSVDWSAKGAVTPIKNQGQCGSCWAFSTTGSVEGATFIAAGKLISLSEQQLVDCSGPEGNQGCNGGLMDQAFQYIIDNKGITTEAAYPYTGVDGTCKTNVSPAAAITGFTDVTANSETALETAIVQQPISVAVEADQNCFQFYTGGVMTASCGTNLDHGVLAVGYGVDPSGGNYYKVKNSWGASWGEAGYIRLGRGSAFNPSGQCGIQMMASYPTGASIPPPSPPGPPTPPGPPPPPPPPPPTTGTPTTGTPTTGTPTTGGTTTGAHAKRTVTRLNVAGRRN